MTLQCGTILDCWHSETNKGFKEGKIKLDGEHEPIIEFTRCPFLFKKGERVTFEIISVRAAGGGAKGIAKNVQRLFD